MSDENALDQYRRRIRREPCNDSLWTLSRISIAMRKGT